MENTSVDRELQPTPYEAPRFEVISLSCEISAYAPDDSPLF
jgi:hypothetical protein